MKSNPTMDPPVFVGGNGRDVDAAGIDELERFLAENRAVAGRGDDNSSSKVFRCLSNANGVSTGNTILTSLSKKEYYQTEKFKAVSLGRIGFLASLLGVAIILGVSVHRLQVAAETKLAEKQFRVFAESALSSAKKIAYRKLVGGDAMAAVVGQMLPDADKWPFVSVPGYIDIASKIVPTSLSLGLNFAPIVLPEQVNKWERFAYEYFDNFFPNGTIYNHLYDEGEGHANVKSFGRGIWSKNTSLSPSATHGTKFHDTTGNVDPSWKSPNKILVPKFHHARYNSPLLMFQAHYPRIHGTTIDGVIECAGVRKNSSNPESIHCGSISNFAESNEPDKGPGGFVVKPIYPANNNTTLTGFIVGFLYWEEILNDIFNKSVDGIDCVLATSNESYTYEIMGGKAVKKSHNDSHATNYTSLGKKAVLLEPDENNNNNTETFTLSLYPNWRLYKSYQIDQYEQPWSRASIFSVLAMFFTSLLFVLYDFFVRRDFLAKKELLEAKRQFVRFVSHEVRTPLNSVFLGLALLQEDVAKALGYDSPASLLETGDFEPKTSLTGAKNRDKGRFQLINEVQTNAQSGIDLLNDLLNYDKIESGTLCLELTIVDVWNLVRQTVKEFMLPAMSKKISLELIFPEEMEANQGKPYQAIPTESFLDRNRVIGDTIRITQVLRNLISNAVKFTPESEDGKNVIVEAKYVRENPTRIPIAQSRKFLLKNNEVLTSTRGGTLTINVKDCGAGMTKRQLGKLFGQGVQFNVNVLQGGKGSGLGLFISKGIAEQHGGNLEASSEGLGCGTTFTLTLPLFFIPDANMPNTVPLDIETCDQSLNSINDYELPFLRILVVDDSCSNRSLLCRLLTNHGHDCEEARDGQSAANMVKETEGTSSQYDLIMLDYEMEKMNGPTAAKEIRAMGCDVFIIGVTGNMMTEDVELFKFCGANAVLPKPFKISYLEDLCMEYEISNRCVRL